MENEQLEQALFFAGEANDIASLKSLARQENRRAEQLAQMLAAVLAVAGPIRINGDISDLDAAGFSMTAEGDDDWILAHLPHPNRLCHAT